MMLNDSTQAEGDHVITTEDWKTVLVSFEGGILTVTLNRPDRRNAITPRMLGELGAILEQARKEPSLRVLVIGAAGSAFCSGADLTPGERPDIGTLERSTELYSRIEDFPHPVIAAVQGPAAAGGFELILCCDLVLAAKSARMADVHANVGLIPGAGGAYRLVRRLGESTAKRMLFTGEFLSPDQLHQLGLVTAVFEDDVFAESVRDFASKIAAQSPLGLGAMKRLANAAWGQDREAAMHRALQENAEHATTVDYTEGLAAMAERRSPVYVGR